MTGDARHGLRSAAAWTLAGYALFMLSQLGIIVALAQLASTEDVGRYGLALAVSTPILMFTNLGLRLGQSTDAADAFGFGDYLGLRILSVPPTVLLLALAGAALVADPASRQVFGMVAVMKVIESFSDLFYGSFQRRHRMDLVARSLALRGPLTLAVFAGLLAAGAAVPAAFLAQTLVWAAVAVGHDWRHARALLPDPAAARPVFAPDRQRRLVRLSLPLGFASLFAGLVASVPRLLVEHFLGLRMLGIFTALAYAQTAGLFFANAMGQMLSAPLAAQFARGAMVQYRRLLRTALLAALAAGAGLLLAGTALGRPVLGLVFGLDYAAYTAAFVVLLAVLAVRIVAVVLQTALAAQRRFAHLGHLHGLSLALVTGFSLAGVWLGGMMGVCLGLLAAALIHTAVIALVLVAGRWRRAAAPPLAEAGPAP